MMATKFAEKDIITDAVTRVMEVLDQFARGEVCSWERIETAAGFDRESSHWSAFVMRLKRRHRRERGIVLFAVSGVGFKLLTTDEQLNMRSEHRLKKAIRQLTRDREELRCTPDVELSHFQRVQKTGRIEQTTAARKAVLRSKRGGDALMKPTTKNMPRVTR